ncbi:MAG TPA: TIGR00375 family protein [Firmicutes bacterium]|nr:TIGR00375 family protein [Bacillota bacterium]
MICYADFHVHIGMALDRFVKITASRRLTVTNAIKVAKEIKGVDILGIVDCGSKVVLNELLKLVEDGQLKELAGGGLICQNGLLLLLGWEIEIDDVHYLCYLPTIDSLRELTKILWPRTKNIELSTQRFTIAVDELRGIVENLGGIFFPAHAFTPHKGFYGKAVDSLYEKFSKPFLSIELGLSSSTEMVWGIKELKDTVFLSNSDAHSLEKIAREYNEIFVEELSFRGVVKALEEGSIIGNYGLDPRLGKYYETACIDCGAVYLGENRCKCGGYFVKGVRPRLVELEGFIATKDTKRPPYIKQIPLEFLPKIGPKTIQKLHRLGTELEVLNSSTFEEIQAVAGEKVAETILQARDHRFSISVGGAGYYGRVRSNY